MVARYAVGGKNREREKKEREEALTAISEYGQSVGEGIK